MCITVLPKNGQNQCLLYLLFFSFAMFYENNNNNNNNIFACYEINFSPGNVNQVDIALIAIYNCFLQIKSNVGFFRCFQLNVSDKTKTMVLA